MTALPVRPTDAAFGLRLTADGFFALGETDERMELVDGVVVMSPSALLIHQRILQKVQAQFEIAAEAGVPIECVPDSDIRFSDLVVYRPDVCIYRAGRLAPDADRPTTPPDVAVEVQSPSNRRFDLVTKFADYARFGVPEYWVIDPHAADFLGEGVAAWVLEDGRYVRPQRPDAATLTSARIDGLRLDLRPLAALVAAAR